MQTARNESNRLRVVCSVRERSVGRNVGHGVGVQNTPKAGELAGGVLAARGVEVAGPVAETLGAMALKVVVPPVDHRVDLREGLSVDVAEAGRDEQRSDGVLGERQRMTGNAIQHRVRLDLEVVPSLADGLVAHLHAELFGLGFDMILRDVILEGSAGLDLLGIEKGGHAIGTEANKTQGQHDTDGLCHALTELGSELLVERRADNIESFQERLSEEHADCDDDDPADLIGQVKGAELVGHECEHGNLPYSPFWANYRTEQGFFTCEHQIPEWYWTHKRIHPCDRDLKERYNIIPYLHKFTSIIYYNLFQQFLKPRQNLFSFSIGFLNQFFGFLEFEKPNGSQF